MHLKIMRSFVSLLLHPAPPTQQHHVKFLAKAGLF